MPPKRRHVGSGNVLYNQKKIQMGAKDYYIGIIAIFFAFTLSKYLDGIISFWIKKNAVKFLLVHPIIVGLWTVGIFQYMWSFFPLMNEYVDVGLFNFLIFLSPIFVWQVSYFYLFPSIEKNNDNLVFQLDEYFDKNRTSIYILICIYILIIQFQVRFFNDPIESNLFLIIRMSIFTALLIGVFVKNYRFDVAITSIMFLVLLFFFIQDLSPNTTVLKIQIDSSDLQKRELIWRNTFVQIDNDTLTSYAIDPKNGKVVVSDKPFTIGNKITIKIVRKLDAPIEFNFIQKNENFSIPLNKIIHVDTEPK